MKLRVLPLATLAGCLGAMDGPAQVPAADAGDPEEPTYFDDLDKDRARATYPTTAELSRRIINPGCAAERNECHSNEDFPDLSSEGNLWNLAGLRCNVGVGDRKTIEDFCEAVGDELAVTGGANAGFVARIGSITAILAADGAFQHYEVRIDRDAPAAQTGASFEFRRDGAALPALGGGDSLALEAGSRVLVVTGEGEIPDGGKIRQGDENQNGQFGDGTGVLVRPGSAHDSYLIRRLLGQGTDRQRMPLNFNADNPTEQARLLTPDEMYSLMSWINCMDPAGDIYQPIDYDCPANAGNEGTW